MPHQHEHQHHHHSRHALNRTCMTFESLIDWCQGHKLVVLQVCTAAAIWSLAHYCGFGSVAFVSLCIVAIFCSTSKTKQVDSVGSRLSAYSMFNRNATPIAGSLRAQDFERQLRNGQPGEQSSDAQKLTTNLPAYKGHPTRKSAAANTLCVCGSGKKYKKCCSLLTSTPHHDRNEEKFDSDID